MAHYGVGGDHFAKATWQALRAAGYRVYIFSERVVERRAWQDVREHGLTRCAAFIAITSPTYACLDHSPWSASELQFAFAERRRRGAPRVLALWHTGPAPPTAAGELFCSQQELPDVVVPPPANGQPGAACQFAQLMQQLVAALQRMGVHPAGAGAHFAAPAGAAAAQ